METGPDRGRALSLIAVGFAVVILAVLLFGLETDSGEIDWVSVIMTVAGAVMVVTGVLITLRSRASSRGSGPHTAA